MGGAEESRYFMLLDLISAFVALQATAQRPTQIMQLLRSECMYVLVWQYRHGADPLMVASFFVLYTSASSPYYSPYV